MFKLSRKIKLTILGVIYGMMSSYPAVAEDIEIYKGGSSVSSSTQANILLVLDTSGSMGSSVIKREPYDLSKDYSGGNGCYDNNKVYVLPYGTHNAYRHCRWPDYWWYGRESNLAQANRSAVKCQTAASLDTIGYFTGRMAQFRGGAWRDSMTSDTAYVECEADSGVHGETTSSSAVYAANGGTGWSSNAGDSINWAADGLSATVYRGHYINYIINAPIASTTTRIATMQDVISDLVDTTSGVNMGLMRFDSNGDGGMMAVPVADLDSGTQKADIKAALTAMTASGGTPLSESFYEAAMYFQGKTVDYGNSSSPYNSVATSKIGGAYKSPITNECQKNYVVILTDGDPTGDSLNSTRLGKLGISSCSGNCLDEIAKSIATTDQNATLSEDQFISTFTIGFAIDNQLLIDTASESHAATGIGERYLADDYDSLRDKLNEVLEGVFETDTTFSSPAVSVNAFNRSTHLDDLYFTLFKPAVGAHWPGNFKKYKLDFFVDVNDVDADNDTTERLPFIADANSADAIEKGFFSDSSRSYWSVKTDGGDVTAGGSANVLPNPRNVYTYTGSYTDSNGVQIPATASALLTSSANEVSKSNSAITETMLDIVGEPEAISGTPRIDTLLEWASGVDVFDEYGTPGTTSDQRLSMGDPLHSEPALVQYGGTIAAPDLVAYVATNDGYLQAFDTDTGEELFSFIPQELLPNLNELMENDPGDKTYGLDGNVTAWVYDANKDGIISGTDHVYLYIGMRRGGKNIYSLDVTDRTAPKLRWVIKGGVGGYAEMGQTWSSINVAKVKDGSVDKDVIVFGGGYDTNQDSVSVRTADSEGRAVYIADAKTGALLWSAGPGGTLALSDMDYSIPARIKPLDVRGDGYLDRMYAVDMGGQIFRFDIDNDNNASLASSIKGGRIASISGTAKKDARRFYYPPDVALIAEKGKSAYLALSISSGYRAHPLDDVIQDRIYLFRETDIYNAPSTYKTLTESDLYDATLNLVAGDGSQAQNDAAQAALDSNEGWYIKLDDQTNTDTWVGEKGLSETLIIDGVVVVTTFIPNIATTSSCSPESGIGRVYYLDLLDASAAYPSSVDKRPDRYRQLDKGGIPPSPNVVITKGGEPTLCIGTECELAEFSMGVRKTYWYEVEK